MSSLFPRPPTSHPEGTKKIVNSWPVTTQAVTGGSVFWLLCPTSRLYLFPVLHESDHLSKSWIMNVLMLRFSQFLCAKRRQLPKYSAPGYNLRSSTPIWKIITWFPGWNNRHICRWSTFRHHRKWGIYSNIQRKAKINGKVWRGTLTSRNRRCKWRIEPSETWITD